MRSTWPWASSLSPDALAAGLSAAELSGKEEAGPAVPLDSKSAACCGSTSFASDCSTLAEAVVLAFEFCLPAGFCPTLAAPENAMLPVETSDPETACSLCSCGIWVLMLLGSEDDSIPSFCCPAAFSMTSLVSWDVAKLLSAGCEEVMALELRLFGADKLATDSLKLCSKLG